jgi:hypothetical protein
MQSSKLMSPIVDKDHKKLSLTHVKHLQSYCKADDDKPETVPILKNHELGYF